jgi:hypothetical protein
MIKQSSRENILAEPGVDVLNVRKGSVTEDLGYTANGQLESTHTQTIPGKNGKRNKKGNNSFTILGFNLIVIGLMLFGYRYFLANDNPSALVGGFRITIHASIQQENILCIADVERANPSTNDDDNVKVRFYQGSVQFTDEKVLPKSLGETIHITGILRSDDAKKKVFAEITLGQVSSTLSVKLQL